MDNIFTIEEVNGLSGEINRQLQELAKASPSDIKSFGSGGSGGSFGSGFKTPDQHSLSVSN